MKTAQELSPVVVAGAGPVGLTMAAELARYGIPVRVVDPVSEPATTSRAIVVHARTLEIFAAMGVIEPVLALGRSIHGASVYDGANRIIHFDFDELDSPYRMAIDLPQWQTEQILTAHLGHLGVAVERRKRVESFDQDESGVTVRLSLEGDGSETVRASYLIGCDGAYSTVRERLGIPMVDDGPADSMLIADARIEWNQPDDEWLLWFHEDGLLSVYPLPGGLYRIIADNTVADARFDLLLDVWKKRAPVAAVPSDPAWISAYRLQCRHAEEYRRGRVFLAGDAAHVYTPTAGQGMNTGVQDAYNLAWKLALVMARGGEAGLLDSYAAERQPIARGVQELTERVTSLATLRRPVTQTIRDRVLKTLAQFEVIEQRWVSRISETSGNYRGSPIVGQQGRWFGALPLPGDRAPAIGEVLFGTQFKVLLFTGEQPSDEVLDNFRVVARYMAEGYAEAAETWLIAYGAVEWDGAAVEDPKGEHHLRYGAGPPCIMVVRPDQYLGFRSLGSEPLPLLDYLGSIFDFEPKVDPEVD